MGFDLSGIKPISEEGMAFRNNVWWWRPLWEYICETCPDVITLEQAHAGTYNDGIEITGRQSKKIFLRLQELKENGRTSKHEVEHQAKLLQQKEDNPEDFYEYPFSEENVDKFAHFCKESGGFEIW